MNNILKRLYQLEDDDLLSLSEAIDVELEHRLDRNDGIPDSARRRALAREHSYRRSVGSSAPPIRAVGLRDIRRHRAA
jgi:predicted Zn-dependent peptidase